MTMTERLLRAIQNTPGSTDRDLTDMLLGTNKGQQAVNQAARRLEADGKLLRRLRPDGKLGNYPTSALLPEPASTPPSATEDGLSEDELKLALERWLTAKGWQVYELALGKKHGADIRARRGDEQWVIEVKGIGSRSAMRVNYFLAILGETLQRMDDPTARYSIALPDVPQYRGLWERLPRLAKERTGISALFVSGTGDVVSEGDTPL